MLRSLETQCCARKSHNTTLHRESIYPRIYALEVVFLSISSEYIDMKSVNIQSLLTTRACVPHEVFDQYTSYLYDTTSPLKPHEWETLTALRDLLGDEMAVCLDGFYIGYRIPQVGKEFDLLQIGTNALGEAYILNIELKQVSTQERILAQLLRNDYYLRFAARRVYLYSFDESLEQLYRLEDEQLIPLDGVGELKELLRNSRADKAIELDDLFEPANYLISPFSTVERFVHESYFLTQQQEEIKRRIGLFLEDDEATRASILGGAGTGKTLLTYDLVHSLMQLGRRVLLLHCGALNDGQRRLRDEYGWHIREARQLSLDYEIIVIDEAQRLGLPEWERLQDFEGKCIYSLDPKQCFRREELETDMPRRIEDLVGAYSYELTGRIRTNRVLSDFVRQLFDRTKNFQLKHLPQVEVHYFTSSRDVRQFARHMAASGWIVPAYTPSRSGASGYYQYEEYFEASPSLTAHSVAGQEYDRVFVVIDQSFYYDGESGELRTRGAGLPKDYLLERMLYQIITRARTALCLVILDNPLLLSRCMDILDKQSDREQAHKEL